MNAGRIGTLIRLELTQRVRSLAWYVLLGVFALILLIVTVFAFAAFPAGSDQRGSGIYSTVIYIVLLLVVLVSPTLSGNAINGDRDAATLAPVQVTLATTGEIILGKFLAGWVTGLAFLAVAVPFALVATIVGGVSALTLVVSLAVLIVEIGAVAAIGVALSGILARPLFSVATTYLVIAALCLGTLIAFGLGAASDRVEVTSTYRSYVTDDQGNTTDPLTCGDPETSTYEQPRTDRVWWMLSLNPFVVLADATPTMFTAQGYPVDLFGQIKTGVRGAQQPPVTHQSWDDCDPRTQESTGPTPEQVVADSTPSWFVGIALQLMLSVGLLWWAWVRTRTPTRRLPTGTRVA